MNTEFYPASMSRNLVRIGRGEYSDNLPLNAKLTVERYSTLHVTALASDAVLDHLRKVTLPANSYKL